MKQKRTITPRKEITIQANVSGANPDPLDIEIHPETSSNTTETTILSAVTSQFARRGHSPEAMTPTSMVNLLGNDDGRHTPEGATTPENTEENEQRYPERRALLSEIGENERDLVKTGHN